MLHHSPAPSSAEPDRSPPPVLTAESFAPGLCACPGCRNVVREPWEETGRLCARCAIEEDLYDREARRERAFGLTVV